MMFESDTSGSLAQEMEKGEVEEKVRRCLQGLSKDQAMVDALKRMLKIKADERAQAGDLLLTNLLSGGFTTNMQERGGAASWTCHTFFS